MTLELGSFVVATERFHLPPMALADTLHWDGIGPASKDIGSHTNAESDPHDQPGDRLWTQATVQAQGQMVTGRHARPSVTAGALCIVRASPPQVLDWEREAESVTFTLDRGLLLDSAHDEMSAVTGELIWIRRGGPAQAIALYVHPVLLVHAASESLQVNRVALVPHLHAGDPLIQHVTLVLRAEISAEGLAGRLYAQSLTNALVVHFLGRYRTSRSPTEAYTGGLSKYKLRRTAEYIEVHLEQELPLAEIAAVAQTSPNHFVHLFRLATGRTPHQYVIMRRIERAKHLLRETTLPIIDIGRQVGFTDQSYFTAVFRKHVSRTPKAYRSATQR